MSFEQRKKVDEPVVFSTSGVVFIYFIGGLGVFLLREFKLIEVPFWYELSRHELTFVTLLLQTVILWFALAALARRDLRLAPHEFQRYFSLYSQLCVFMASILYVIVSLILNADLISSDVNVRHSGDAGVQRAIVIFGLFLLALLSKCRLSFARIDITPIIIICVILASTIYSAATASRTAAVPFILQALLYLSSRKRAHATVMLSCALLFLFASLASRSTPSFVNFHLAYLSLDLLLIGKVFWGLVLFSFPGGSTLDVVLGTRYLYPFEWPLLPLYLSPLPSILLPDAALFEMSLSYPLGINRDSFSLNFDLYTEGYYWFGFLGLFLWPLVVASVVRASEAVLNSRWCMRTMEIRVAAQFSLIYMLLGGMVFTLRAGSRYLLAVIFLALVFKFVSRLRFSRNS